MRRFRYWLACKLVPEFAVYTRPSSALFARATLDQLHAECRWVDDETRERLNAIMHAYRATVNEAAV